MKLFKRVEISILRRKTFSLVLLLFTFLMGNVMAVSITISQSSEGIKENLLARLGGKVILESDLSDLESAKKMNDDKYDKEWKTFLEIYQKLSQEEYIEYADLNLHYNNLYLKNEETYHLNKPVLFEQSYVHGVESKVFVDEKEEKLNLIEGEYFTQEMLDKGENVMIVSNKITHNGQPLKIGDEVEFSFVIYGFDNQSYETIQLINEDVTYRIIGIYQQIENKYSDIQIELENFYVPNQSILKYATKEKEIKTNYKILQNQVWIDQCILRVDSLEHFKRFKEIAENLTLDTNITPLSSEDTIEGLLGPIQVFSNISKNIFWFSMIAMSLISGLITFYFVKDRKHEMGIYLSLGMRKMELIVQIILETLAVGMLGIFLSIGSGRIISESYSDYLLNHTIYYEKSEKDKYTIGHESLNPDQLSSEDIVSTYEVVITMQDIMILISVGCITLLISSGLPLSYILRLKPKNIMLN
ncbi:MAG: FtsX-like permease family protein [Traorella sp.]